MLVRKLADSTLYSTSAGDLTLNAAQTAVAAGTHVPVSIIRFTRSMGMAGPNQPGFSFQAGEIATVNVHLDEVSCKNVLLNAYDQGHALAPAVIHH